MAPEPSDNTPSQSTKTTTRMALQNSIWPLDLPAPKGIKTWLATLFATVGAKEPDSGAKLANLYTSDVVVYGLHGKSEGTEAIIKSRQTAWDYVESRNHKVLRVYTASSNYSDVLQVGKLTMGFKNCNSATAEFIARILFEEASENNPKASLYQVWGCSLGQGNDDDVI
ncbi:uncharacterized protein BKA55DRAFT_696327 [Fusarium redolens]|uniref:Uncharacterized protein n=1 Tax=Fusarium redolens TaxID=48865 RepID=A0A9P9G2T7_FUSRE|nr:uncharacterized protein BKA55DRAFT_696327 [Fusarium redolens]KAH7231408.1 hypothetical protein BKA55DRAFT_696327 [Fusarium redolens]